MLFFLNAMKHSISYIFFRSECFNVLMISQSIIANENLNYIKNKHTKL